MTTLTDYGLALECMLFAGLLWRQGWLWAAAFGSVSVAAMMGGTFHGFAPVLSRPSLLFLWQGTVVWLAIASWLIVVAAATKTPRLGQLGLVGLATAKLGLSLGGSVTPAAFALRVIDYISALAIVLAIQGWLRWLWKPSPQTGTGWMLGAMALSGLAAVSLVAPWLSGSSLSPMAIYHLVQMIALYCLYRSISTLALV